MKIQKRYSVAFTAACLVSLVWMGAFGNAQETPGANRGTTVLVMRAKLAESQRIFEGIVTEEFKLIRRAAQRMDRISKADDWPTVDDKSYQHYQETFRRQSEKLAEFAKSENLAGAHFSYLQLATTCSNCHEHVRKSFTIKRDEKNPDGPVILIPNYWNDSKETQEKSASRSIDSSIPAEMRLAGN